MKRKLLELIRKLDNRNFFYAFFSLSPIFLLGFVIVASISGVSIAFKAMLLFLAIIGVVDLSAYWFTVAASFAEKFSHWLSCQLKDSPEKEKQEQLKTPATIVGQTTSVVTLATLDMEQISKGMELPSEKKEEVPPPVKKKTRGRKRNSVKPVVQ